MGAVCFFISMPPVVRYGIRFETVQRRTTSGDTPSDASGGY